MQKRSNYKRVLLFLFLALWVMTQSCALMQSSKIDDPQEEKKVDMVWPPPPDEPRVKFIRTIRSENNVAKKVDKSLFVKILEVITGAIFGTAPGEASIVRPYGIAVFDDIMYVADSKLRVIHLFDFKANAYFQIGLTKTGELISPIGVATDKEGNLYVSDSFLNRIFVYNAERVQVREIGAGAFQRPTGIAVDSDNNKLYVVDTLANKILVFDLQGSFLFEFGQRGNAKDEDLNFPTNIFVGNNKKLYVSDSMNFKIKIYTVDGKYLSQFGKLGDKLGYLARPKGVAVDSEGNVYVVESLFDRIQIFNEKGQLLLSFGVSGNMDGAFWLPSGIFIDSDDRIYIADSHNNRVQIFQYIRSLKGTLEKG